MNTTQQVPIYIYDRLDEPTRGMLEDNLAYAEGGETAVCFASGMAAINAALAVAVKSQEEENGGITTTTSFPRFPLPPPTGSTLPTEAKHTAVSPPSA